MTIMTIMTKMSSFKITGARGTSVTYLHFMGCPQYPLGGHLFKNLSGAVHVESDRALRVKHPLDLHNLSNAIRFQALR